MKPARPIRILMLEDNELDAELTRAWLDRGGLEYISERVDTRSAYSMALDSFKPDVILADYSLPQFDGMTALGIAREACPDVPFLFVSGVMGEEVAIGTLQRGATDYVLKQRLGRLIPAVKRALGEAEERIRRRQAEAALRESEERYRILVESAREYAIILLDMEGAIVSWNAGAERMFGYTDREVLGKTMSILFSNPEDVHQLRREMETAAREGRAHDERWKVRKDGTMFWSSGTTMPALDASGVMKGFVKIMRDNTERKRVEEERQTLLELEQHRVQELARYNVELEQFAYIASHDLQEPLRMVNVYTQMLTRKYEPRLDEEATVFVGQIRYAISKMETLLRDLLSYSRVLDINSFETQLINTGQILDQVIAGFSKQITEAHAEVTHSPLPEVKGDPERFKLLFENLLDNALKYQEGEHPVVRIDAAKQGSSWVFSVKDNGIGFERKYAAVIFGLFRRLHRDKFNGSGVGLTICRKIVERHGGNIWAESEPGKGATFYFSIPA